jgi:two-component system sensor histidine kinase PilS (NtrC family)
MQTATSNNHSRPPGYRTRTANWTSLRLLNVYRLGLSAIFFSQSFVLHSPLLDIINHRLYSWVSLAFLVLSLVWMLAARIERRGYQTQLSLQIYSDTILFILLMHACGGISSGLGMLLIISIAVIGLLGEQTLAIIFASLASLGLLAEYVYSNINLTNYSGTSTQVGLLGVTLFATAIVTNKLTLRIRSSEQLVQQRERDVALLSALNQEIIENLQAGVVVLAGNNRVRYINNTALKLLDITANNSLSLQHDQPRLLAALESWRQSPQRESPFLPSETGIDNLQVSFRQLQRQGQGQENTLIFLNDVSSIRNSMQQAKLASLGHLTASIAHEIRNPLGAISYAAQLLSESSDLARADQRMTEIIHQHSDRINHIIEDILQISRGGLNVVGEINLYEWLPKFIENFCLSGHATADRFELDPGPKSGANNTIRFDQGHLTQIMTNLCTNALIHGKNRNLIHIKVHKMQSSLLAIEIADEGPGIESDNLDKIFEPFYTTNHKGSGLGLYIVNQLCELNDASISVKHNNYQGTSFTVQCPIASTAHSRSSAA